MDLDKIGSYYEERGGAVAFGRPISRTFWLLGCQVQLFELRIIQACPDQATTVMNLLDPDLFPYTHINGGALPGTDLDLKASTPQVGDYDYAARIIDFIEANVPDFWNGVQVGFVSAYFGLLAPGDARADDLGLLRMTHVELWGAPVSAPFQDPNNVDVIYQRMQKGMLRHLVSVGRTEAVPLVDYFKQIVMDEPGLPADLRSEALRNHLHQYCPGQPGWLCRPTELPGTDLTRAFEDIAVSRLPEPPIDSNSDRRRRSDPPE